MKAGFKMINKNWKWLLLALVVILSTPATVSFLMEQSWMDWGSQKSESWMSFWGGYLGSIIGIIGAITATTLQIKSQTNQIVVAAKENDKLERKRINLNLKIEKNVELFKSFIELKSMLLKYVHIANELITEQEYLVYNYSNHASAHEKIQNASLERTIHSIINNTHKVNEYDEKIKEYEIKFNKIDEIVDKSNEKISLLKNELNHISSSLKAISTDILANIIFIDENDEYYKKIEKYIEDVRDELLQNELYKYYEDVADIEKFSANRKEELNKNCKYIQDAEHLVSYSYQIYMKDLVNQIENYDSNNEKITLKKEMTPRE